MGRIIVLDENTANQIAAGEVVERPALAIKELVENSLDAGATAISVEARDGGLSLLRVADNGCGIAPEQLRMAFQRNATSKIARAEDLLSVATMGFRGEALASIAAVSRVRLTTRRQGGAEGAFIELEGGQVTGIGPAACAEGTSVTVRDLFFNVPARRKFLQKPAQEAGLISDWMARLMFSRTDVSMRLTLSGRQVMRSAGDGSLRGVAAAVWGRQTAQGMMPVDGSAAGCAWHGLLGVDALARQNRSRQVLLLNGRAIRSAAMQQAVERACRGRVLAGQMPCFILRMDMPCTGVDVNVHPNKLEVRFQDEVSLAAGLEYLVRTALEDAPTGMRPEGVAAAPLAAAPAVPADVPPERSAWNREPPRDEAVVPSEPP